MPTVPQAEYLGLTIPDPDLRWNEETPGITSSARSTGKNSSRCWPGNGKCNKMRMKARRKAHEEGAWVREAALAYAEKQRARSMKKAS